MLATGRRETVDHQVNLTQVLFDGFNGLGLDLIGESIAIDALGIETLLFSVLVKSSGVIPAGSTRLAVSTGLFKEDTKGRSTAAKGCGNARRQTVAS